MRQLEGNLLSAPDYTLLAVRLHTHRRTDSSGAAGNWAAGPRTHATRNAVAASPRSGNAGIRNSIIYYINKEIIEIRTVEYSCIARGICTKPSSAYCNFAKLGILSVCRGRGEKDKEKERVLTSLSSTLHFHSFSLSPVYVPVDPRTVDRTVLINAETRRRFHQTPASFHTSC